MKLRSLYFLFLICFISTPALCRAADISFNASVDRKTISTTDQLVYTLTIEGARGADPILPTIPDFELLGRSDSTQFSLVNTQTRIIKNIAYTLMPIVAGNFTIPSAQLEYAGKTYITQPIVVTVIDGPAPTSIPTTRSSPVRHSPPEVENQPKPQTHRNLFIRTTIDKKEAYVDEQITLNFNLFDRGLRIADLDYSPPPTIGFTEKDLGNVRRYNRTVEGVRYNVSELSKAIFPISSGEITIGPAEIKGDNLIRRGGFWGRDERQPFIRHSDPIKLTVKPLPREGRPDNFKRAVGDFRFNLTANPLSVKVGEPITVTMTIAGTGNLDTVSMPEIKCGDSFKTYVPEARITRSVQGGRVGGEKIFKQVIIPLSVESKEIPAVSFSYFNPGTGKYQTIKKGTIRIKVESAPDQGPINLVEGAGNGPGRERIKLLEKDILYIKDNPGHLTRTGQVYYRRPLYWIIPVAALLGLLAVWAIQNRRDKLRSDQIYARQVGASRSARKRFKKARIFLNDGDSDKFYSEVHRAFNRYLGDKLGVPSGAVGSNTVAEKLSLAGASAEILDEVKTCFSDFDLARFARSSSDKKEMEDFLKQVESLIGKLEKSKI